MQNMVAHERLGRAVVELVVELAFHVDSPQERPAPLRQVAATGFLECCQGVDERPPTRTFELHGVIPPHVVLLVRNRAGLSHEPGEGIKRQIRGAPHCS
jgi:hypothetical protein